MKNIGEIGGWFGTIISIVAGIGIVVLLASLFVLLLSRLWGVC